METPGEFGLIKRLQAVFADASCRFPAVLGIGDDAAVLAVPPKQQLVVTSDTLVSGVHFLATANAGDIAAKALAVSLSDLAAMGAQPAWFFLAVTLPEQNLKWWDNFAQGLLQTAQSAGIQLAGGDTTRGPLSITITALGLVDNDTALRRSGARKGDVIVVSGNPGLAALALQQIQAGEEPESRALQALYRPVPRVSLGRALSGLATACVDVSDGLAADLSHILDASDCAAELQLADLPVLPEMTELSTAKRWLLQLGGGDDYELCFTLTAEHETLIPQLERQSGIDLHVIGRIVAGKGIKALQPDGEEFVLQRLGYEHFSPAEQDMPNEVG